MSSDKKITPKKVDGKGLKDDPRMPMGKRNYILMAAGFILIVIGFILMSGGGSDDPTVFNAEKLYSFRRITLAPIIVLVGFAVEIYAIMMRPKNNCEK